MNKLPFWKKLTFQFIWFSVMLLLVSILGEAVVRALVYQRNKRYPTLTTVRDQGLGSRAIENFHWEGVVTDVKGTEYPLRFSTDGQGFRRFDDPGSKRKKVFFLGDSFTQAIEASDDKTYFSLLADSLGFEAFAYGCRGFSTLQEWMLLEKYLPVVKPDAVVLQFCSNDFVNNHFELERHSEYNNNWRRRPYLGPDGNIYYAVPGRWGWNWLKERSLFYDLIFTRFARAVGRIAGPENTSEFRIEKEGLAYRPLSESIEVTGRLLAKFKDGLPAGTELIVFTVDNVPPFFEALDKICDQQDITLVSSIPQQIDSLNHAGQTTLALDGAHWNELGHAAAASVLAFELRDLLEEADSASVER